MGLILGIGHALMVEYPTVVREQSQSIRPTRPYPLTQALKPTTHSSTETGLTQTGLTRKRI